MATRLRWRVVRGMDFGDFLANRYEPGDILSENLPVGTLEDLQLRGAIAPASEAVEAAVADYKSRGVDDLAEMAEVRSLTVEGTGREGNVLKEDLIRALEHDDELREQSGA